MMVVKVIVSGGGEVGSDEGVGEGGVNDRDC